MSDAPAAGPASPRTLREARIARIVERAPDARSLFLSVPDRSSLAFVPGQFLSCQLPVGGDVLTRPYSIASNPDDEEIEICLNRVPDGAGSRLLFDLTVDDTIAFTGPWGTFTLGTRPAAECVFVAEDTAIAPLRPMIRRALASPHRAPLRLHYAATDVAHLLYRDEFDTAARVHSHFTFEPLIGAALETCIRERYVDADGRRDRHFYICGVGAIVPRLRDRLRQAGYERRAVHYEKW